jgi:hypothetical protein
MGEKFFDAAGVSDVALAGTRGEEFPARLGHALEKGDVLATMTGGESDGSEEPCRAGTDNEDGRCHGANFTGVRPRRSLINGV